MNLPIHTHLNFIEIFLVLLSISSLNEYKFLAKFFVKVALDFLIHAGDFGFRPPPPRIILSFFDSVSSVADCVVLLLALINLLAAHTLDQLDAVFLKNYSGYILTYCSWRFGSKTPSCTTQANEKQRV